jgi:N-acetyl-gamma-glutamyl-phosphate reductase
MKKIGIIGATGYTGEELLRVLTRHPNVSVAFVTSEQETGTSLAKFFPQLPRYKNMTFRSAQEVVDIDIDLVFLCLPPGYSAKLAKPYVEKAVKVIDLGADFRYDDADTYKHWCGIDHPHPELLEGVAYGLPEWNRDAIKNARIVSNPGCYPTTVLLALIPFLKAGVLANEPILVDSKSGISGAGSSPTKTTLFGEIHESFSAYKPGRVHRHVGEMEQELSKHANRKIQVVFTPHLAPMFRGLFSTIYVRLQSMMDRSDLLSILHEAYANEPFVGVLDERLPAAKMATHSNFCFLSFTTVTDSNVAILFSTIDNLGKGASWQAIQNMNLMLGFPEQEGLV